MVCVNKVLYTLMSPRKSVIKLKNNHWSEFILKGIEQDFHLQAIDFE